MSQQGSLGGAGGTPVNLTGNIVQVVSVISSAALTITAIIPPDNTIPQQTEGTEIITLAITPTKATNRLIIDCNFNTKLSTTGGTSSSLTLFQDANLDALDSAFTAFGIGTQSIVKRSRVYYTLIAGTSSATTFKVRGGVSNAFGSLLINNGAAPIYGGTLQTVFTIMEVEV